MEQMFVIVYTMLKPYLPWLGSTAFAIVSYLLGRWIGLRDKRKERHIANMERVGAFISYIYKDNTQQAKDLASITAMLYVQYEFKVKEYNLKDALTVEELKEFFHKHVLHSLTYKDLV